MMENKITISLTYEQTKDLAAAITAWLWKKAAPSNYRHRAERITALKKEYAEQKNLDAVCLAANGGRLDLLSGRAGELREAIKARQKNVEFVEQRIDRMRNLRDALRALLPEKEQEENE